MSQPRLPKYLKPAIKVATAHGWDCSTTRANHVRFAPPPGWRIPEDSSWHGKQVSFVIAPKTPSDWRGRRNFIAQMRRMGLNL